MFSYTYKKDDIYHHKYNEAMLHLLKNELLKSNKTKGRFRLMFGWLNQEEYFGVLSTNKEDIYLEADNDIIRTTTSDFIGSYSGWIHIDISS